MLRFLYFIFCVALAATVSAQVKVAGRVTDLQSKPVADVIVKLTSGGKTLAFTSTNARGEYGMTLKETPRQEVTISQCASLGIIIYDK